MIEKIKVTTGVYWISIPEADLIVLCGCPEDITKHLIRIGLVREVEKQGVVCETGPNAILLSDVLIQNGKFSNLAEFPVLQMLYKQGLIIPNHPNNTGIKPLLIGSENQVHAQMKYLYRGNYGLVSKEEIVEAGVGEEMANEMMRMKLKFAFGNIRKSEELLDSLIVDQKAKEIRNGVFIKRTGFNRYQFQYKESSVEVDLNLPGEEEYQAAYELGWYQINREYFSIIHTGEGDGWDINRPCMSSILVFQGKIYLIDAGPNISASLSSLGISINEVEGVFHTHLHDDHFAGLTTLLRADHKIKYYSTALVRSSVSKKLSELFQWNKDHLESYFEIKDLNFGVWNNVEGLEVKPIFSPHPVETNIFYFRTLWEGGYQSYAHLADIVDLDVLEGMVTDDSAQPGISKNFFDQVRISYLETANIKKIDAGGGLIHGKAVDFIGDKSEKLIVSHKSTKLTLKEKEIGSSAPFGVADVLIPTNQDYIMRTGAKLLLDYFPEAPPEDLRILLNFKVKSFNAGTILVKAGDDIPYVYLILSGFVEKIYPNSSNIRMISIGSIVAEMSGLMGCPARETFRASSFIRALKIPVEIYTMFMKKNNLLGNYQKIIDHREFLETTWLFGELVSHPVLNNIAKNLKVKEFPIGAKADIEKRPGILVMKEGEMAATVENNFQTSIKLRSGDFFGEDTIVVNKFSHVQMHATKNTQAYEIGGDVLNPIPVVLWKLLETSEKRSKNEFNE
ncbi:MAG: cyclic nucleotide-binding domain-containing protein [Nitrospinales bacterium]